MTRGQPPSLGLVELAVLAVGSLEGLAAWSLVVAGGLLGGGVGVEGVLSTALGVSGADPLVEGAGVAPLVDGRDLAVLAVAFAGLFAGLLALRLGASSAVLVSAFVVTALSFVVTAVSSATFALATFTGGEVLAGVALETGAGRGAGPEGVMV